MEEKAGKGKTIAVLAVLLAFCAFGWFRISETLPPTEADLRAMFAEAEAEHAVAIKEALRSM